MKIEEEQDVKTKRPVSVKLIPRSAAGELFCQHLIAGLRSPEKVVILYGNICYELEPE